MAAATTVVVLLTCTASPRLGRPGPPDDGAVLPITVYWVDGVGLPDEVDEVARSEIVDVFATAGIAIVWDDLAVASRVPRNPPEIEVILVRTRPSSWGKKASALGWTPRRDVYDPKRRRGVYVFVNRIRSLLSVSNRAASSGDLGRAIGRVVCHEIAHVLGVSRHTRYGVLGSPQSRESLASGRSALDEKTASSLRSALLGVHGRQ